jgi:hypothetical protein
MHLDASGWSGEGEFTQVLVEALKNVPAIAFVKVEDAPASRSDATFSFISNEVYVSFENEPMTIDTLSTVLAELPDIGAPDYADDAMLQYLRTQRIVPPYQTRGYKLIEMVRVYRAG